MLRGAQGGSGGLRGGSGWIREAQGSPVLLRVAVGRLGGAREVAREGSGRLGVAQGGPGDARRGPLSAQGCSGGLRWTQGWLRVAQGGPGWAQEAQGGPGWLRVALWRLGEAREVARGGAQGGTWCSGSSGGAQVCRNYDKTMLILTFGLSEAVPWRAFLCKSIGFC